MGTSPEKGNTDIVGYSDTTYSDKLLTVMVLIKLVNFHQVTGKFTGKTGA